LRKITKKVRQNFKTDKNFAERAENGDWEKAREILAQVPDTEADDLDKL